MSKKFLPHEQYKTTKKLEDRSYLHSHFSVNKDDFNVWIFDHFPNTPNLKILELGCGTGSLWVKNIKRLPPSWELTLTDLSPAMIEKTKENLIKVKNKQSFSTSKQSFSANKTIFKLVDAQNIPFKDNSFDIVIANHMFYHVPDRKKALSEIKRVLKSNGLFFASTTGQKHMKELNDLLFEFDPSLRLWHKDFLDLFVLENGAKQISQYFPDVTKEKFDDILMVPEVKPLIDYVLSTQAGKFLTGAKLNDFTSFLEDNLKNGPIKITKDIGLFIARKN